MSEDEARYLLADWPFWARTDQRPPALTAEGEPWSTWLYLGGRGAGKTRAGAEWLRAAIEAGAARRIAIVAETQGDAREVMVEGPSGLCGLSWRIAEPRYYPSRRRVNWSNGAVAQLFSAEDPDGLRGYQFDTAWADELAKWPNPQETWDMLQLGLRLGRRPRQVVTTTPRPVPLLKALLADPNTVVTRASTFANRGNLAASFFSQIIARFEGTRLGRQELEAEILEDNPDGLWHWDVIEANRVAIAPALNRIVVAIDPPVTSGADADACGVVVAGLGADGQAYILADHTVQGASPLAWARIAVKAFHAFGADRIVAEVNQGGELVEAVIRQVEPDIAFRAVRASRGKHVRAEPVAALYEQRRVHHVGSFPNLEDEMCTFSQTRSGPSPDRLDALVWALTDLMLSGPRAEPRLRRL